MTRLCLTAWVLFAISTAAHSGTLYYTEFEEFPVGDNKWAGTSGWQSNDMSSGAQGIIQDPVGDLPLGRTGYLGFERPVNRFTSVFKNVSHDPVASGLPILTFDSLLGVQDSTNGRRDRFHISLYNTTGSFLAGIIFDNTTNETRRDDGTNTFDTGIPFLRGDPSPFFGFAALQILYFSIDLPANRWSAYLDGIPLFTDAPFTSTGQTRTIGPVAAEWTVAADTVFGAGNNWLLVSDWLVVALPREPFETKSFVRSPSGQVTITWPGHKAFDYQVQHSPDLLKWSSDLPGSSHLNVATDGPLSFTHTTQAPNHFFRIVRIPAR